MSPSDQGIQPHLITDQLRSDASKYLCTDSLKSVNQKFPFIATFGGHYNNFYGHKHSVFDFLLLSEKHGQHNCICENTSRCGKLNLYFDFDSKNAGGTAASQGCAKLSDREIQDVINNLKNKITTFFPGLISRIFVKDASDPTLTCYLFSSQTFIYAYKEQVQWIQQLFHYTVKYFYFTFIFSSSIL